MIIVNSTISIPESELTYEFVRAGGPGGQHVNKVATAVQLRFNVVESPSLPNNVRERLQKIANSRISDAGVLVITSKRHRTQTQNRADATDKLIELIRQASKKPKKRRKTKPSLAAKRKRLDKKKQRSQTKQRRKKVNPSDY